MLPLRFVNYGVFKTFNNIGFMTVYNLSGPMTKVYINMCIDTDFNDEVFCAVIGLD